MWQTHSLTINALEMDPIEFPSDLSSISNFQAKAGLPEAATEGESNVLKKWQSNVGGSKYMGIEKCGYKLRVSL